MKMVRLIYFSQLATGYGPNDINDILLESRAYNPQHGISGVLCYDIRWFLQWLEGERSAVNRLYARILKDPRHTGAEIIEYSDIESRLFGDWSMAAAVIGKRESALKIVEKYCGGSYFSPMVLDGEGAMNLMIDVAEDRKEFLAQEISIVD